MDHIDTGIRRILNSNFVYRTYQLIVKKRGSDLDYVTKYIQPKNDSIILDIGCGPGTFLEYYSDGVKYDGFDINQDYINYAKAKYGIRGNFECKPVNDSLNFGLKKYDIITANALFHHISDDDASSLLKTVSKLLKDGGYLVTLDPVYVKNQNFISKKMIQLDRGQNIRDELQFKKLASTYFNKIDSYYEDDYYIFPFDLIINKFYK